MSIPYGTLRDIANELKNIREILEKRSTAEIMEYPQVDGITPTVITKEVNLSYVEWLEQITITAEYQPDWICDELVCEDGWCENRCKSKQDRECLKRYYNKHFDCPHK